MVKSRMVDPICGGYVFLIAEPTADLWLFKPPLV